MSKKKSFFQLWILNAWYRNLFPHANKQLSATVEGIETWRNCSNVQIHDKAVYFFNMIKFSHFLHLSKQLRNRIYHCDSQQHVLGGLSSCEYGTQNNSDVVEKKIPWSLLNSFPNKQQLYMNEKNKSCKISHCCTVKMLKAEWSIEWCQSKLFNL